jgi:hypothetical protein
MDGALSSTALASRSAVESARLGDRATVVRFIRGVTTLSSEAETEPLADDDGDALCLRRGVCIHVRVRDGALSALDCGVRCALGSDRAVGTFVDAASAW